MDVLAQLARNTGYSVRVNHKVLTTVAASNKQGDVEIVNFGLDGSNSLVIDVLICCDHVGNSTINNGHLNGKMHTHDYLQARAVIKNNWYKADYAAVGMAFAPAVVSVVGQIHPEFLRLLWVLADKQTRNYYALIGAEEEIGSETFTWSRARTSSNVESSTHPRRKFSFDKAAFFQEVQQTNLFQVHSHLFSGSCLISEYLVGDVRSRKQRVD